MINIVLVGDRQCASFEIINAVGVIRNRFRVGANVVRVVGFPDVATFARSKEGGRAFVACDLSSSSLPCWQLEDVSRVGGMVEVVVEPPLLEGIISKRGNRSVVVRIVLVRHIEPPHARVEKS